MTAAHSTPVIAVAQLSGEPTTASSHAPGSCLSASNVRNRCRADFSMRRLQILTFRNRCLSIGRVTAADQSGIQEMYSLHSWRPGEGPPLLRPDPRAGFCGPGHLRSLRFNHQARKTKPPKANSQRRLRTMPRGLKPCSLFASFLRLAFGCLGIHHRLEFGTGHKLGHGGRRNLQGCSS